MFYTELQCFESPPLLSGTWRRTRRFGRFGSRLVRFELWLPHLCATVNIFILLNLTPLIKTSMNGLLHYFSILPHLFMMKYVLPRLNDKWIIPWKLIKFTAKHQNNVIIHSWIWFTIAEVSQSQLNFLIIKKFVFI